METLNFVSFGQVPKLMGIAADNPLLPAAMVPTVTLKGAAATVTGWQALLVPEENATEVIFAFVT